eukprot:5447978-Pyramimonas_sp.AAC.1
MANTEFRNTLSCARARALRAPSAVSSPPPASRLLSEWAGRPAPVVANSPSSRPGLCSCRLTFVSWLRPKKNPRQLL